MTTTLDKLEKGIKGKITKIKATGALKKRLVELGIIRNEIIEVKRRAPLGDPIEFCIKNYCLTLGSKEARSIEVEYSN